MTLVLKPGIVLQSPSNSIWKITSDQVNPPGDAALTYDITNSGGTFNLRSTGTVGYEVEWGDGDAETSTINTLPHVYIAGNYTLDVYSSGLYRPFFNGVAADANQVTSATIGSGANLGTSLQSAWQGASNMTSFACPFDRTSSVTSLENAWFGCSKLLSMPLIDTSSVTSFRSSWYTCRDLVSFPLLDTSSGTIFRSAWFNNNSLTTFPASMFDTTGTLASNAFDYTWLNCALTAQSIENILVSLDTNGASNINLGINGGTNAAKTTWSTAAVTAYDNLIVKGWTISFNA